MKDISLQVVRESKFETVDENNWLSVVQKRIKALDWTEAMNDVRPFLESEDDIAALSQEALVSLYSD